MRGSLVILAIAAFFSGILTVIDSHVPDDRALPAGTRLIVGHGIALNTVGEWSALLSQTTPGETSTLSRDASVFTVGTQEWTASEAEFVTRTRRVLQGAGHLTFSGEGERFETASGRPGLTFTIHGRGFDGRVWILLLADQQRAVTARLHGPTGQIENALDTAAQMVAALQTEYAAP